MKSGKYFGRSGGCLSRRGVDARMVERCGFPANGSTCSLADAPDDAGYLSIIMVKE
ncbi:MAG: hypothetical protein ACLVL7_01540 [Anaerotruncus massiliensis (ex Togo et al. 2019)]